jgi:hypothetical protein
MAMQLAYPSGDEGGILLVQIISTWLRTVEEGGGGVSTLCFLTRKGKPIIELKLKRSPHVDVAFANSVQQARCYLPQTEKTK